VRAAVLPSGTMSGTAQQEFAGRWAEAQPHVAAYLGALLRDGNAADDLLQEVAITLWRKYAEYDPARPFLSWAIGMARLEVLAARRAAGRSIIAYHSELLDAVGAEFVAAADEADEIREALRGCLQGLGGRAMRLLRLRYEEALKPQAIAARMDIQVNAVRVALHRARAALERCIGRRIGGPSR
jgi:RNA polymerase sigma-70 factor (ECF subfamily)